MGNRCLRAVILAALIANNSMAAAEFSGRVVSVTDGDTLTVMKHKHKVKIRIAGIDAPEKQQAFGKASKQSLARLASGREVFIEERGRDNYGRTLGRVMHGRSDLGLRQIELGLAWHYRQYARNQPIVQAQRYAQAEKNARRRKVGLWRDSRPVPPWSWRHAR